MNDGENKAVRCGASKARGGGGGREAGRQGGREAGREAGRGPHQTLDIPISHAPAVNPAANKAQRGSPVRTARGRPMTCHDHEIDKRTVCLPLQSQARRRRRSSSRSAYESFPWSNALSGSWDRCSVFLQVMQQETYIPRNAANPTVLAARFRAICIPNNLPRSWSCQP
eukprot:764529-Hanusia_phi.AAC.8